jgi:hypothetical protein
MSQNAWIFQSSPVQYDLPAALVDLREFAFSPPVRGHEKVPTGGHVKVPTLD